MDVQNIILSESIKTFSGILITGISVYFRTHLLSFTKAIFYTAPISLYRGITFIGSDEFRGIPLSIVNLDKRIARIEKFTGPNGGQSILDGINNLKGSVSYLQSAIKTSEVLERELINAKEILLWISNSEGSCIWASTGLQTLTGYSFEDGFKGWQWENIYFKEDFPNVQRRWLEAIETAKSIDTTIDDESQVILSMTTRYKHRTSGEEIPVYYKVLLMPDKTIIGIVTDLRKK